jgi:DNA (cytosine-5)-methyltransferase 1
MVTFIDLFCGIGSFHYSLKKLGFECVMACDISKPAKDTYFKAYDVKPMDDIVDIKEEDSPSFDILCAGFPCQPFSNIGKHKGFNDERGTMFFQIIRIVKHHKPSIIILENVSALLKHDKGNTFEKMMTMLDDEHYDVAHKILKCDNYGIPQMRKRLFIIGVRKDIAISKNVNMNKLLDIETIPTPSLTDYLSKPFVKKTAYTIRCGGRSSPIDDKHNWDGYIVDDKEYRLSINDCLKLQGFEGIQLEGSITQQYKLLGNTIPTNLTYVVAKKIKEVVFNDLEEL